MSDKILLLYKHIAADQYEKAKSIFVEENLNNNKNVCINCCLLIIKSINTFRFFSLRSKSDEGFEFFKLVYQNLKLSDFRAHSIRLFRKVPKYKLYFSFHSNMKFYLNDSNLLLLMLMLPSQKHSDFVYFFPEKYNNFSGHSKIFNYILGEKEKLEELELKTIFQVEEKLYNLPKYEILVSNTNSIYHDENILDKYLSNKYLLGKKINEKKVVDWLINNRDKNLIS